jgi:hypothetical protein
MSRFFHSDCAHIQWMLLEPITLAGVGGGGKDSSMPGRGSKSRLRLFFRIARFGGSFPRSGVGTWPGRSGVLER